MEQLRQWFGSKGWKPYAFQEEAWAAYARGDSGLIHVPTGAGKTYAAYIGPLANAAQRNEKGLQVLYLTP
ncbi:DEAD/DEAH box helicase, partial [Variovorax sp. WS11]|uniref:DEAD/DEAH box helicase n=1 Tax=Variovorax sp. WS11 TaxID=1105204 RepID=UPI001C6281E5